MYYMGEIISLAVFCLIFVSGCVGLYLIVRAFHRKWKWQDKVNENNLRRAMLEEFNIDYEVDSEGFVRPVGSHSARSSGRAR